MPKLVKQRIDAAATEEKDVFIWCSALPGFGVRVKKSGTKTFIIQYRNRFGRSRRVTLGRFGTLTLEEARQEARRQLSGVLRGRDPRHDRDAERKCITVNDLFDRFIAGWCEGRLKPSTLAAYNWLYEKKIKRELGSFALVELRREDVRRLHQDLKNEPYNANRSLGLLKSMLHRAEEWELIPQNTNPACLIRFYREQQRKRPLRRDELERLARALEEAVAEADITPAMHGAFWMLLATGARRDEVRLLRWQDVDLDRAEITLDEHKSDEHGAKSVALNRLAVKILTAMHELRLQKDKMHPYVFPGAKTPGAPISDLERPWQRVRKRAGLLDLRLHDLRHGFAYLAIASGATLPVVGKLLGHRTPAATAVYAHVPEDVSRDASQRIAEQIERVVGEAEARLFGPGKSSPILPPATGGASD